MLHFLEAEAVSTTIGNMIFVSLSFLLLVLAVKKFAWKQIVQVFEDRRRKINNDLDSAEEDRVKANELKIQRENELNRARQDSVNIVNEAKEAAKRKQQTMIAAAKEDVNAMKLKAKQDIESDKEQAYSAVKEDVATMSLDIAAKILGKELDQETHEALIDSCIEGLAKHEN